MNPTSIHFMACFLLGISGLSTVVLLGVLADRYKVSISIKQR